MTTKKTNSPVRLLPEDVANKIAAGEVVERPASVVKELVENALDAGATRVKVRVVGAGRRLIEVTDNGFGMSEQDAMMAVERHATSKIRKAEDLDNIHSLGFRGEALASIAAVSRFELLSRREKDESATHVQIDGGILRDVSQRSGPVGTRVTVNRLYFNTPVRAKFLKGITTELSHCIDVVQRHALVNEGVAFQFVHNEKVLLDIPEHANLRERVALIWGLGFANEMVDVDAEQAGFRIKGLVGSPSLSRSSRSHQFFFMNDRPVVNRSLQYGFEDGYHGLLTIGRHPVGVVTLETHPRFVDVNIHPAKREIRFRDERAARDAVRDIVRTQMASLRPVVPVQPATTPAPEAASSEPTPQETAAAPTNIYTYPPAPPTPPRQASPVATEVDPFGTESDSTIVEWPPRADPAVSEEKSVQTEFAIPGKSGEVEPMAVYTPVTGMDSVAMQLFDTYLLVPEQDRLLIIDQHALHERLNYDELKQDLDDYDYAAQQLAVPVLVDVPPAHGKLLEASLDIFAKLGIEIEPFGGDTFQVTGVCHLYDEARIADAVYRVLDELAQGNLFDREEFMADFLRLTMQACKASVKAGDQLSEEEKAGLLEGFRRMRPPYTCPHGRPIITELTLLQMEKSFRRRQ